MSANGGEVSAKTCAARVVSLVPSLTETVAQLGRADRLVGVTRYCTEGAPGSATRVGGTKSPDVAAILALDCDLVLANAEENRPEDLGALRAAGVEVLVTFPRRVDDVGPMLRSVGCALEAEAAGERLAQQVETAITEARSTRPVPPRRALVLVWRRPWIGVGSDTYIADLLRTVGLTTVPEGGDDRYPRVAGGDPRLAGVDLVFLPSEPFAFSQDDLPAVRELVGDAPAHLVDGALLTWHGTRTAEALAGLARLVDR